MILYGCKLWTSNTAHDFQEARALYDDRRIDCVEIKYDPDAALDFSALAILRDIPAAVHSPTGHGWHEFDIGAPQMEHWRQVRALADFLRSSVIVVHPGGARDKHRLKDGLDRMRDSRIVLENMPGVDMHDNTMYAGTLAELREVRAMGPICFDIEKAVKSACFQRIDYKEFIADCMRELRPVYFHISGGDKDNPIDEHANLYDAGFEVPWVAGTLCAYAAEVDVRLIFETPKQDGFKNDIRNMNFFQSCIGAV